MVSLWRVAESKRDRTHGTDVECRNNLNNAKKHYLDAHQINVLFCKPANS